MSPRTYFLHGEKRLFVITVDPNERLRLKRRGFKRTRRSELGSDITNTLTALPVGTYEIRKDGGRTVLVPAGYDASKLLIGVEI